MRDLAPSPQLGVVAAPTPTFGELYEMHFDYVWHAVQRLGVASRDAEDLVQEVFLTAYQKIREFDPARPIKPWLFGIAFRLAADFRALARHTKEVDGAKADRIADEKKSPDDVVASRQASQLVAQALDGLDLDKRAVFVMHELHGHVVPEIADALNIPLGTAYSRLRAARVEFATKVAQLRESAP